MRLPTPVRPAPLISRITLLGTFAAAVALTGPAPAGAAAPETLIQQRAIAMQGLSIGLGMVTLTSQFNAVFAAAALPVDECTPLHEGGSIKVLSSEVDKGNVVAHLQIYFDTSCGALYMDEHLHMRPKGSGYVFDADIDVYARSGRKVATMTLTKNTLATTKSGEKLYGPALIEPTGRAPVMHLGLSCELPSAGFFAGIEAPDGVPASIDAPAAKKRFACVGGSAQTFSKVKKSIGALTQVILRPTKSGRLVFEQAVPGETMTGRPGALSVEVTSKGKVTIAGKSKPWSTNELSGGSSGFVVFPSKPTGWTIVDQPRKSEFAIGYGKTGKTVYQGAVNRRNGTPLAPFSLDASGSGKIRYSDGVRAKISSWTLTK